jgi:hypothetical protein
VADKKQAKQQVQKLTRTRQRKMETLKRNTALQSRAAWPTMSDDTRGAYLEMLEALAPDLTLNSKAVEEEQRRESNYSCLRVAVVCLLRADQSTQDTELSRQLRQRTDNLFPPDH